MEKIICAAVKIDRDNEEPIIIGGHRHPNCIKTAIVLKACTCVVMNMQGFLTSRGRFVSRKEAFEIATKAGQIIKIRDGIHELFSEDLY